jgi:hypothetical protein
MLTLTVQSTIILLTKITNIFNDVFGIKGSELFRILYE